MQKLLTIAVAVLLGACNAAPKEIATATGQKGHVLDCSPAAEKASRAVRSMRTENRPPEGPPPEANWGQCLKQAGDICGARGYDVLERHATGSMVIQCKG